MAKPRSAHRNRRKDQQASETGSPGMLGMAGTAERSRRAVPRRAEPTPDLPQTTSPTGAPDQSPYPSEGLPPQVTGTPSTRSANDVLGTPGNVSRAPASNVEPGTTDIPGTPTPGPTGAEPNTIDTTAQRSPAPARQDNAERKALASRDVPGDKGPSDAEPSNYNLPGTENPNPMDAPGDAGQPQS